MSKVISACWIHNTKILFWITSLFIFGFAAVPSTAEAVEIEINYLEYRIDDQQVFYSDTYNGFIMVQLSRTDFNLQKGERIVASIESYDIEKKIWTPRKVVVMEQGEEAQTLTGDRRLYVDGYDNGDPWDTEHFRLVLSGEGFSSKKGMMTLLCG